ncbi:hypothetical protein KDX16_15660 [Burkholderia vietnamiensis]|jgi:hypothetical protein|uniref:DUF551 domain-containing protein n=2 Tax=Burkholderia cepacia complex TaxID=87882 RepID=A0A228HM31_9BURK|nr:MULTISPECIES: hypothetical protein [Burkholderia]HDR9761521.1 hypothetical protein [Burkholderia cepacia ATCC 25416]MBR7917260.1 hypothetical protein [Burkholderia vietnamiensis]MBR8054736.1 hypothetical protein [Burkholderia vietnamiensis]MDN7570595.1 hypothetical protein [Burkholderia contaminans]OXI30959.1 hypothetical protein CFB84_43130 [Burkholderia aenigmatica]
MSNSNIVTLLAEARSALYAIAKTYDDHELRARALEVYESTAPETASEDADRTLSVGWCRLTDSLPDSDRYPRVLIYTEGVDFNGEQFFDVKADSLNENSYESPDDQPEICRAATHWMPRPFVDSNAQMAAPAGRWVHCSPALIQAGVNCEHTPRRPCQCQPENGGHDHFIAFNVNEASKVGAESRKDLARGVFGGINALRWLLNITTEFDRKDVRTRQAARLLDEFSPNDGITNRVHLERLWKALHDQLSTKDVIACLRAHADWKPEDPALWALEVIRLLGACRLNFNWPDLDALMKELEERGNAIFSGKLTAKAAPQSGEGEQAGTGTCESDPCGKSTVRPAGGDPAASSAPSSPCHRCVSWGYCAGHGCMALPGTDVGTWGPQAS